MNTGPEFSEEQKSYLQGFAAGADLARSARGLPTFAGLLGLGQRDSGGRPFVQVQLSPRNGDSDSASPEAGPRRPESLWIEAQNRFLAEGKKLAPEEEAKRRKHPLDLWDEMQQHAEEGRFPKGTDVFLFKFQGLFYCAPAQDAFMCRLRLPGGILTSTQMRGVAEIASRYAGGAADVTTRANLQIREIRPGDSLAVLTALHDLGIVNRGAGADNIRNITGSPTAGIDPQELIDTRPLSREMHHAILNHRELYGLPRKFNVAFDGGGLVSSLAETNDLGFQAVRVAAGRPVPPGDYFRLQLGGITGHQAFAQDAGVLLETRQCVPSALAAVRIFIEQGDRTDRKKARLRYLLDRWGIERFLEEMEKHLPFRPRRFPLQECEPRGPVLQHGHVGFHPQRQPGLLYAGVVLPAGHLTAEQMAGLATLSERHGSGTVRLTVWQNLIVSDVPEAGVGAVKRELAALGLGWEASALRGGLVACTGNGGCKLAASDTKGHALQIVQYLETRLVLDQPINIHLTGCPNSCAQHSIGDIGLLGTKVPAGDEWVEGYHVFLGGGYASNAGLGHEMYRDVPFPKLLKLLEGMLKAYLAHRLGAEETFQEFTRRHSAEALRALFGFP
ncbi:MAG: NirA family protein [Planctomycetes bacterium]|nr:NirA family protein [Planctomycetota bacterium]